MTNVDDDVSEMSCPEDEQLLPISDGERRARAAKAVRQRYAMMLTLGAAALFGCLAFVTVSLSSAPRTTQLRTSPPAPLTVRSLLEGQELTDLATKNIMAVGGDAAANLAHDHVRAQVSQRFQNISATIHNTYPEVHRQLGAIQLSEAQKESALRVLKKYGDPRMVHLTREVAVAVAENKNSNGDTETLKRRLSDKLGPKVAVMKQLGEEMFPERAFSVDMEDELPKLGKWHPKLEVDFRSPADSARRLAAQKESVGEIDRGVRTQARTLFQSLHGALGDKMPEAHERKLLSLFGGDDDNSSPSSSRSSPSSSQSDKGFMDCVQKAVPNPMDVAKCISDNMQEVISMMTSFMKSAR